MKIKRLLYLAVITVITLGISNNSVAQNVSHTFVVDGKLPLKSEKIRVEKGDNGLYTISGRFTHLNNIDKMTLVQFCMKKDMESMNKHG